MSLVKFESAISILRDLAQERQGGHEEVSLAQAIGRVAAQDYLSHQDLPAFGNSSMDGFAVVSSDTQNASPENPLHLHWVGTVIAGDEPPRPSRMSEVQEGASRGAWEIMTGAPLPQGYDGVVKIEDVEVIRDLQGKVREVVLKAPVLPGQNHRGPGEDFQVGTPVLERGKWVTPEHILGLAALGISKIKVVRRPSVFVVSTGNELAASGQELRSGQIHNSTGPFLIAVLEQLGAQVSFLGTVTDEPNEFIRLMENVLLEKPDIVITTGGVSMGKHDFVKSALVDLGAEICFHKISMRPGKPNLLARFPAGPTFFGLPGNPVSTVVGLRFLVEPYIRHWMGRHQEHPWRAQLKESIEKPEGLRCFFKSRLEMDTGILQVSVLAGQASFMIRPLLQSNAWAVLPEEATDLRQGNWIDVYPLYSSPYDWRRTQVAQSGSPTSHARRGGCC